MKQINMKDYFLWTALITPLDENGQVDFVCLASLALQQQAANNGVILLGSTGEGLALSEHEQRAVITNICGLSLTIPVMVAVSGINLSEQLKWINWCEQLPIHGYLLTAPVYAKPGPAGQYQWFKALLDTSSYPCMLYNVPSRAGINIDVGVLSALSEHPNCWSLKEASGDLELFSQYIAQSKSIEMLSGDDGLYPEQARLGATGLVSVCANAWSMATKHYVDHHLDNCTAPIDHAWQQALSHLCDGAVNPIPIKSLMHIQGQINTRYLRLPLTHLELEQEQYLITAQQLIDEWMVNRPGFRSTREQLVN